MFCVYYVDINSHSFASHANSSSSFCICLPRQKERGKRKFRNGGSGGKRERIERGVKRGRARGEEIVRKGGGKDICVGESRS
jgi:hypothetical protein